MLRRTGGDSDPETTPNCGGGHTVPFEATIPSQGSFRGVGRPCIFICTGSSEFRPNSKENSGNVALLIDILISALKVNTNFEARFNSRRPKSYCSNKFVQLFFKIWTVRPVYLEFDSSLA
ncbi:MAG: hypothetical protein COB90_06335 [Hyphomicrobiales bacterium]|nr:MAG: hypothetical protein COB90_06335 [Hyphomicrobiales bacterium]